jgi:NADH-quinone oxidoreductase subunit N
VASSFTLTVQFVVLLAALGCVLLTVSRARSRFEADVDAGVGTDSSADRAAHHALLLAAVTGAVAVAGVRDLLSLVVAFELASLPVVALVAWRRDLAGARSALTLLITAIGSLGLLLLGVACVLLATGSLYLAEVATVVGGRAVPGSAQVVVALGLGLIVAGVVFKVSAAPFHWWTADTYAGAPVPVAAFLAVVSKAAGLTVLIVVLVLGFPMLRSVWAPVLSVLAVASMTVGNVGALRQRTAVRLLAWSTIGQAGWLLLPLATAATGSGGQVGETLRTAAAAALGYFVAYAAASLTVFAVVAAFAGVHPAGRAHVITDYRGFARSRPVAAAALSFAVLCLAGLPPGVMGVMAKVLAVRPVVDNGMWVLAVVAAVNVAVAAIYYLRWLVQVLAVGESPSGRLSRGPVVVFTMGLIGCVALSVAPRLFVSLLPNVLQ